MKKVIATFLDVFFLTRPILLVPVWTILALGWITGADQQIFGSLVSGSQPFWILSLSFTAIAAFIFVLNQIADIEGDRENGKLFLLHDNYLSTSFAWVFALLLLCIGLVLPWLFLEQDIVATGALALGALLGFMYNLKPFSLKDRPWGGLWANFMGHGVITYFVGWYATNIGARGDELLWGGIFALSAGFANGAVYLTSTIPDAEGDKKVGKQTFAVIYGEKKCAFMAALWVTISLGFSFLLPFNSWVMWVTALLSTALFWRYYGSSDRASSYKTFRWPVIFLSAVVSFYIPLYALLIVLLILLSKFYYKKRFNLNYPAFGSEK